MMQPQGRLDLTGRGLTDADVAALPRDDIANEIVIHNLIGNKITSLDYLPHLPNLVRFFAGNRLQVTVASLRFQLLEIIPETLFSPLD